MKIIKGCDVVYGFSFDMEEKYRVSPLEEFVVETNDCFYQQIQDEDELIENLDHGAFNPATGPIYVEGAEPGDVLKVKIKKIEVDSKGCSLTIPDAGFLPDRVTKALTKIIEIKDDLAIFSDEIKLPIRPMIGVIGVATRKEDGMIATDTPYRHGGNMDTTDITAGTNLYLPVAVPGAMLALGDLHAVMGDGEVCVTGLEIPGKVILEVEIIKNKEISWPILENKGSIQVIASDADLEKASRIALEEMIRILEKARGLSFEEAYILSSLAVDMKISQLVNPKKTARAAISKDILDPKKLFENYKKIFQAQALAVFS